MWTLSLDSELIFIGDAGNTEAGRPSHRYGVEWANYYSPRPWLTLDVDLSLSRARFTDDDPAGDVIPGAVSTVVQAGVTVDSVKNVFGSVRWRYFGPRALIEDDSVRSQATSLVNLEAGYRFTPVAAARRRRLQPVRRRGTATSTTSTRRGCRASPPRASTTSTCTRRCRARRASACIVGF